MPASSIADALSDRVEKLKGVAENDPITEVGMIGTSTSKITEMVDSPGLGKGAVVPPKIVGDTTGTSVLIPASADSLGKDDVSLEEKLDGLPKHFVGEAREQPAKALLLSSAPEEAEKKKKVALKPKIQTEAPAAKISRERESDQIAEQRKKVRTESSSRSLSDSGANFGLSGGDYKFSYDYGGVHHISLEPKACSEYLGAVGSSSAALNQTEPLQPLQALNYWAKLRVDAEIGSNYFRKIFERVMDDGQKAASDLKRYKAEKRKLVEKGELMQASISSLSDSKEKLKTEVARRDEEVRSLSKRLSDAQANFDEKLDEEKKKREGLEKRLEEMEREREGRLSRLRAYNEKKKVKSSLSNNCSVLKEVYKFFEKIEKDGASPQFVKRVVKEMLSEQRRERADVKLPFLSPDDLPEEMTLEEISDDELEKVADVPESGPSSSALDSFPAPTDV